ncbi:uncharacterized protein LOC111128784 isoform X2 [Crassostrea virginica]
MTDRGDGIREADEEEEEDAASARMRDAARKVFQQLNESREESPNQSVDLHEVDVELPTYDEAMEMKDTSLDKDNEIERPNSGIGLRRRWSVDDSGASISAASPEAPSSSLPETENSKDVQDKYVDTSRENGSRRGSLLLVNGNNDDHAERRMSVLDVEEGARGQRDESGSRFERFIRRRKENISFNQLCCAIILVTLALGAIVFLGVFPASFVYLDYYQIAMKYNKITGVVDRSTSYEYGCYILGPSVAFLEFDATAQTISKTHGVFTVDRMPITITYHVQYFLKRKEIGVLHSKFGMEFDSVIGSVIESEIKNSAVPFKVDQFRLQRSMLEKYFHQKLKDRLEGNCCPECCPSSCNNMTVCLVCLPASTCTQSFHISVEYFHLGKVDIPSIVTERYLTRTLLKEYADREVFIQEKVVETTKTRQKTQNIRNTANEIQQAGQAEANKIGMVSSAIYEANLTDATIAGLSQMFRQLKILQEDHKLSLMMIRALENVAVKGNLYRTYGYDNGTMSLYTKGMSIG